MRERRAAGKVKEWGRRWRPLPWEAKALNVLELSGEPSELLVCEGVSAVGNASVFNNPMRAFRLVITIPTAEILTVDNRIVQGVAVV
jgi:hypothetical protein